MQRVLPGLLMNNESSGLGAYSSIAFSIEQKASGERFPPYGTCGTGRESVVTIAPIVSWHSAAQSSPGGGLCGF
jgi:hypothetical protein